MLELKISGLVLLNVLSGIAEDVATNFYCNKYGKTWTASMGKCLHVKGTPIAFDTGIGKNIEDIRLKSEADVWTANYALESQTAFKQNWLYGFNYLSKEPLNSEIMYSESDVQRYYLCKNDTTQRLDVHKSTRDAVKCTERISQADLSNFVNDITPGYYWTDGNRSVSIEVKKIMVSSLPILCGAYSADKDKYFVDCDKNKSSLCNIPEYKGEAQIYFDKSCFETDNAASTVDHVSHTIPTRDRIFHSTVESTAARSSVPFTSPSSLSENIMTITSRHSLTVNRTTVTYGGQALKQEENNRNLDVRVGVPVGLGVAVLCGILLIIILRRYKCWKSGHRSYGSNEGVSQKEIPTPQPDNVYVNTSYGLSLKKFFKDKKTSDKPTWKSDKPMQTSFPEYAVVRKKNPRYLSQGENKNPFSEEKTMTGYLQDVGDANSSYCCASAEHKTDTDLFVNYTENQKSEYSFAVAMAGDFDNNNEDQPDNGDEDYDVTSNVKHVNTQNNTYNTLQMEEYGSFHNSRRENNTYNVLNMPNDQNEQNEYDTANQRDHNVGTNNLYSRFC